MKLTTRQPVYNDRIYNSVEEMLESAYSDQYEGVMLEIPDIDDRIKKAKGKQKEALKKQKWGSPSIQEIVDNIVGVDFDDYETDDEYWTKNEMIDYLVKHQLYVFKKSQITPIRRL